MPTEPQTVYVVEDDEAARHSAEALLEAMGYRVRAFGSCEAFLEQITSEDDGYLLLDYRFDGITGLELLEELRRRGIAMPTILLTGVFDAAVKRRAKAYNEVVAFLHKPVSGAVLRSALRNAADSPAA